MDPITHSLTGAVLARGGLDRKTPLAATTLVIAANVPDIDILAMFTGEYFSFAFRRGWTHGPIAMVLLPFLVTVVVMLLDRVRLWRNRNLEPVNVTGVFLLAVIGVLTHPILDWFNTYGIRLLMPFSDSWFHGDAVFIIDPWIWLLLGAALFLPRRTARRVRVLGTITVVYVLLLITLSAAGERIAARVAEAQGLKVVDVMYQPRPANPVSGDIIVTTGDAYHFGRLNWLSADRVQLGNDSIPLGDWTTPEVRRALEHPDAEHYLVWSQYPYVSQDAGGVNIGDARFARGIGSSLAGLRITNSGERDSRAWDVNSEFPER